MSCARFLQRATYRYSPLLALLLIPNVWLAQFGKHIFAICDVLATIFAALILEIWLGERRDGSLNRTRTPIALSTRACMLWSLTFLLSPLAVNMSTRGSADSVIVVLLFALLYCLLARRHAAAAILYGLAVHMRVYPIVFAPALYLYLAYTRARDIASQPHDPPPTAHAARTTPTAPSADPITAATSASVLASLRDYLRFFVNTRSLAFAAMSAAVFASLGVACYAAYGQDFLFETYLYHFTRTDVRHNFSPYFLHLYLSAADAAGGSTYTSLITFLPQITVIIVVSLSLYRSLPTCLFLLTLIFVTLNKVVTAQYFLWWSSFLPLLLPTLLHRNTRRKAAATVLSAVLWILSEAHWLLWGFEVEVMGRAAWTGMWVASMVFLAANTYVFCMVALYQTYVPFYADTYVTRSPVESGGGGEAALKTLRTVRPVTCPVDGDVSRRHVVSDISPAVNDVEGNGDGEEVSVSASRRPLRRSSRINKM